MKNNKIKILSLILMSTLLIAVFGLSISDNTAFAQQQSQLQQIEWKRAPKPIYSNEDIAWKKRNITVAMNVNSDGTIATAKITQSSGLDHLDLMVLNAVKKSSFKPYYENGQALPFQVSQDFELQPSKSSPTASRSIQKQSPASNTSPDTHFKEQHPSKDIEEVDEIKSEKNTTKLDIFLNYIMHWIRHFIYLVLN